jgi:signal transduction histidine kinase
MEDNIYNDIEKSINEILDNVRRLIREVKFVKKENDRLVKKVFDLQKQIKRGEVKNEK